MVQLGGEAVRHRSVHPANTTSEPTLRTPPALAEIEHKRRRFEADGSVAGLAQDYVAELRVYLEARLAELVDSPAYTAPTINGRPTLGNHLGSLRRLAKGRAGMYAGPLVKALCDHRDLSDDSDCLALLNKAHHAEKHLITPGEVAASGERLAAVRKAVEAAHEEQRRWRMREPEAAAGPAKVVLFPRVAPPRFKVPVLPDLAASTDGAGGAGSQDGAEDQPFRGEWFADKNLFLVRCDHLGFALPKGAVAVAEEAGDDIGEHRLVIAVHGGEILARRLLLPAGHPGQVALAAEPADPGRRCPPTRLLPRAAVRLYRVVGVLFDDRVPPRARRDEAVPIEAAPCLDRIEVAFRARDESAVPLVLPGQLVLGGPALPPGGLGVLKGGLVAVHTGDGESLLKRVGEALPGGLGHVRLLESVGGRGASRPVATEEVEGRPGASFPVATCARPVLGVAYTA
jgi:hypothetical protein